MILHGYLENENGSKMETNIPTVHDMHAVYGIITQKSLLRLVVAPTIMPKLVFELIFHKCSMTEYIY